MVQKIRSFVMIFIGLVALGLSIKCFTIDDLGYESRSMYGGDAFTGIQNASAVTSKNVKELANIVQFGFGSVLLVMGLTLVGFGLTTPMGAKKEKLQFGSVQPEQSSNAEVKNESTDKEVKDETPAVEEMKEE